MNSHEKYFESTLDHYQHKIREKGNEFYWHRPHKPKWAKGELPCDFWFFDKAFVALELKYRNGSKISRSQIKTHQIETLNHFANHKINVYQQKQNGNTLLELGAMKNIVLATIFHFLETMHG